MRSYRLNSHSKYDLKVHLIWIPKYRKRVLTGQVAERTRDVLRQICMEHEIHIVSGKVAADHVHMFVSYRPQIAVTKMVQYLKGTSSRILLQEFAQLRKQFWGRHLWARGYMAISSGNLTDEMIQKYIEEQEGEIVDDGRFQIDSSL
jgi:REP-associated tyrosine transposase